MAKTYLERDDAVAPPEQAFVPFPLSVTDNITTVVEAVSLGFFGLTTVTDLGGGAAEVLTAAPTLADVLNTGADTGGTEIVSVKTGNGIAVVDHRSTSVNGASSALTSAIATGTGNTTSSNEAISNTGNANADVTANVTDGAGTAQASIGCSHQGGANGSDVVVTADANGSHVIVGVNGDTGGQGDILTGQGNTFAEWQALVTTQAGTPVGGGYLTPLVFDSTATTGGLFAWTGADYSKIGLATT